MLVDVLADASDLLAGGIPAGLQVGDIGGAQLFIGGMPKGAGRASGQGAQTFSSGLVYSGGRAVLASKLILYNSSQAVPEEIPRGREWQAPVRPAPQELDLSASAQPGKYRPEALFP